MQTRSRSRAVATPRQPQSVAALLPEEILDSVFTQFGFDYSMDARLEDRVERYSNLSNMSVVAEGWTRPARRLLFRSVNIEDWTHLQEEVEEGARKQIRELGICGSRWYEVPSQPGADAVFALLEQLPNLRRLRLDDLHFDSFHPDDSASMQSTVLLPLLRDLSISDIPNPHSIIFDLLATSHHQISRLSVLFASTRPAPPLANKQLDFRRNLRFLSTGAEFYRALADPRWNVIEGLRGLEEFQLRGIAAGSREGGEEDLYRVIAPTLSTLVIKSDDVTWFTRFLPLLTKLSRLSISNSNFDPDPTPLLLCLPPSLSFLQLATDIRLGPALTRWTAASALVPAGLKQIQIDHIYQFQTYGQLPPGQTFSASYQSNTLQSLGRLSPGTLPFKTLEMRFENYDLDRRSLVEAECARLGVVFRHRL